MNHIHHTAIPAYSLMLDPHKRKWNEHLNGMPWQNHSQRDKKYYIDSIFTVPRFGSIIPIVQGESGLTRYMFFCIMHFIVCETSLQGHSWLLAKRCMVNIIKDIRKNDGVLRCYDRYCMLTDELRTANDDDLLRMRYKVNVGSPNDGGAVAIVFELIMVVIGGILDWIIITRKADWSGYPKNHVWSYHVSSTLRSRVSSLYDPKIMQGI